eukprot:scaffold235848_cov33-Tisochrysis_lutea.AAC.4
MGCGRRGPRAVPTGRVCARARVCVGSAVWCPASCMPMRQVRWMDGCSLPMKEGVERGVGLVAPSMSGRGRQAYKR